MTKNSRTNSLTISAFDPKTGKGTLRAADGATRSFDLRQITLSGLSERDLTIGAPVTATISGGGVVCLTALDAKLISGGGVGC